MQVGAYVLKFSRNELTEVSKKKNYQEVGVQKKTKLCGPFLIDGVQLPQS